MLMCAYIDNVMYAFHDNKHSRVVMQCSFVIASYMHQNFFPGMIVFLAMGVEEKVKVPTHTLPPVPPPPPPITSRSYQLVAQSTLTD